MSNETKQQLEKELATAKSELESWKEQRFTREDGSPAQDRRFEERGERLRDRVDDLTHQLKSM